MNTTITVTRIVFSETLEEMAIVANRHDSFATIIFDSHLSASAIIPRSFSRICTFKITGIAKLGMPISFSVSAKDLASIKDAAKITCLDGDVDVIDAFDSVIWSGKNEIQPHFM